MLEIGIGVNGKGYYTLKTITQNTSNPLEYIGIGYVNRCLFTL